MILREIFMRTIFGTVCVLFITASSIALATPVYKDPKASTENRIKDLIPRMTLDEKVSMLGGDGTAFATKPVERLGIPSIQMSDGPLGVRMGEATAFPSAISLAATFDPEVVGEMAKAMGLEIRALGRDMLLGPCINIARTPFGGRNFESFGEDPFLTSQFADSYVRQLQAEGVLASTKHFALNDQEHKRYSINVIADERTMQEIHMPAFQKAVNAGTYSVMSSYNLVNGHHASENKALLTDLLKQEWGFQGFVVSDWESVYSTAKAANAGLDLEMPTAKFFDSKLADAVRNGDVAESTIDDKVARILRGIFNSGLFDNNRARPDLKVVGSEAHLAIARRAAAESFVLLKNEANSKGRPVLPFNTAKLKKVALIGPGAIHSRIAGGGSSMVNPTREISPYDAFKLSLPGVQVKQISAIKMRGDFDAVPKDFWSLAPHSQQKGVKGEYFSNQNLSGKPVFTRIDPTINFDWGWNPPGNGVPMDHFSIRWTGYINAPETGDFKFLVRSDDGARLWVDDKLILDQWNDHGERLDEVPFRFVAGKSYKVKLEYYDNLDTAIAGLGFVQVGVDGPKEAARLAAESDVAVVFAGLSRHYEGETIDIESLSLPEGQDDLIRTVAKANPNTVVVITGGNPLLMPWINDVKAVVYAWYPGQEGPLALTDALLGKTNFSGKLPVSFAKRWEDSSAFDRYPEDHGNPEQVTYSEGVYVGYRHFDTHNIAPLFPFGYGLSYTTFGYSNLNVRMAGDSAANPQVEVEFDLKNLGGREGAEVAQLFVRPINPRIDRPFQELKGFERVNLAIGETKRVKLKLAARSFAYYDVSKHDWRVDPGQFELRIGGSSRDTHLNHTLSLR
jgi:beta-glucosidase